MTDRRTGDSVGERLRITDLARMAEMSAQQVRNYVDLGLLPAVERTETGYRIFTARHADALMLLRRMIEGHGWTHAPTIVRAVHEGDVNAALAALDRSHAELDGERNHVRTVLDAFQAVVAGSPAAGTGPRRQLRIGEVADVVGARTSALRFWERRGLLRPVRDRVTGYRMYPEPERRLAHVVALLRRGGYPFPVIEAVLGELRSTGNPHRVRAELATREEELHSRSLRRLHASAALYAYLDQYALAGDHAVPVGE